MKMIERNSYPTRLEDSYEHINIFDLFPTMEKTEIQELIAETATYFQENEKTDFSKDDFAFIVTVNKYIRVFEKAKSMVLRDKFTTEYKGSSNQRTVMLEDFEIIPVKTK